MARAKRSCNAKRGMQAASWTQAAVLTGPSGGEGGEINEIGDDPCDPYIIKGKT
jgi:hypothetical protein